MTTTEWGAIYKEMGAKPVVNATGSVTLLGGSTPNAEVKAAMDAADSARRRPSEPLLCDPR